MHKASPVASQGHWVCHRNSARVFYRRKGDDSSITSTEPIEPVKFTKNECAAWFEPRWAQLQGKCRDEKTTAVALKAEVKEMKETKEDAGCCVHMARSDSIPSQSDGLKQEECLQNVAPGQNVAIIRMVGSFCPFTLGHAQAFIEARRILVDPESKYRPAQLESFSEAIGFIGLNGDGHVAHKLAAKGESSLTCKKREHLIELATADVPWLGTCGSLRSTSKLEERWPHINFVSFYLNGADDVVKYAKWRSASAKNRYITMGRPGDTNKVIRGVSKMGSKSPDPQHFIIGPELPDISSTLARQAIREARMDVLEGLLHPDVAAWCVADGAFHLLSKRPAKPHKACIEGKTPKEGPGR